MKTLIQGLTYSPTVSEICSQLQLVNWPLVITLFGVLTVLMIAFVRECNAGLKASENALRAAQEEEDDYTTLY